MTLADGISKVDMMLEDKTVVQSMNLGFGGQE